MMTGFDHTEWVYVRGNGGGVLIHTLAYKLCALKALDGFMQHLSSARTGPVLKQNNMYHWHSCG